MIHKKDDVLKIVLDTHFFTYQNRYDNIRQNSYYIIEIMSVLPQGGTILGTSTVAGTVLANTGFSTEISIAVGLSLFAVLLAFHFISKYRNKIKN